MPPAATALLSAGSTSPIRKTSIGAEKKYKCQFCNRAFSRSEHRSRHERSHTKERPFKCMKCRSTFVRRDLLLRHDRTVHAKDGGVPVPSEGKRRSGPKTAQEDLEPAQPSPSFDNVEKPNIGHMETGNEMVDIEAAAMLMTDFHHKAMATHDSDANADSDLSAISPHGPGFMDTSSYGSGAMSLPVMPWDQLVPRSVSEAKPSSISSVHVPSHDPNISFADGDLAQAQASQMPPMMDHNSHGGDNLHGINGPMSFSGMDTPGALSPFPPPSMMGPVSPVDYRKSPGPSQPVTVAKAPQVVADEQCSRILENIKRCDNEVALLETFRLPNRAVLNRYLKTYFNYFHHHLPFLHQASFHPVEVAAPLLLAVLSIGALYTFEQDQAVMLHIGSKVLVSQFLQKNEDFTSRNCPLWIMQSTLLNSIFASWSGDPKGLEWACSIKSLLATMVSGNRYELKLRSEAREGVPPTHEEWIEDECCRRSYYAVYIFFGMLTLTFNHTPALSSDELKSLELPSSESQWTLEACDDEPWRECLTASTTITFHEAYDRLFQGETVRYSAFGTRVMISALFLDVWNHKRSSEALQDVVTDFKLRLALENWHKSLELCVPETVVVQLSAPHQGHPLIFNAVAMYRNTRARLLVDLKSIQEVLRYHEPYEVAASMTNARDKVNRSQEMINIIEECFDCIQVAASHGIRWVARTSATNWSVEHPLCGLDLIVILSQWLWRVEHDEEPASEEEMSMYNRLRDLFDEDSVDTYGTKLSATVARLWGSMIDEVVVWGITKLIGESFKIHAQALVGHEDSVALQNGDIDPPLAPRPIEALEMQTAY